MAHAKFSPSGSTKWMACYAATAEESKYPNESSTFADEGTAAHTILSRCLTKGTDAVAYLGEIITVEQWDEEWYNAATNDYERKLVSSRKFPVTQEMADAVQVTVNSVRNRIGKGILLVEQKVDFSKAIGEIKQTGTSDIIMVWPEEKIVSVEDYKHGMGVRVNAFKNKQMTIYLIGVLETFGFMFDDFEGYQFELRIHQPRLDHEDVWDDSQPDFYPPCDVEYLTKFKRQMMKASLDSNVAMEYVTAKPPLPIPLEFYTPGEDQCRFCKAKANCPGLTRAVSKQVFDEFETLSDANKLLTSAPVTPPAERLGIVFASLDLIHDWCSAVRAEVDRMLLGGMIVIGTDGLPMKLITGKKGNRAWKKDEDGELRSVEGRLAGFLPEDKLYKPREIITPSVADKLLNKKATKHVWESIQDLIYQPPGGPKPAMGSEPGVPWSPAAAVTDFQDMTDPTS